MNVSDENSDYDLGEQLPGFQLSVEDKIKWWNSQKSLVEMRENLDWSIFRSVLKLGNISVKWTTSSLMQNVAIVKLLDEDKFCKRQHVLESSLKEESNFAMHYVELWKGNGFSSQGFEAAKVFYNLGTDSLKLAVLFMMVFSRVEDDTKRQSLSFFGSDGRFIVKFDYSTKEMFEEFLRNGRKTQKEEDEREKRVAEDFIFHMENPFSEKNLSDSFDLEEQLNKLEKAFSSTSSEVLPHYFQDSDRMLDVVSFFRKMGITFFEIGRNSRDWCYIVSGSLGKFVITFGRLTDFQSGLVDGYLEEKKFKVISYDYDRGRSFGNSFSSDTCLCLVVAMHEWLEDVWFGENCESLTLVRNGENQQVFLRR